MCHHRLTFVCLPCPATGSLVQLKPLDEWQHSVRQAVQPCAPFLPLEQALGGSGGVLLTARPGVIAVSGGGRVAEVLVQEEVVATCELGLQLR